MTQSHNLSASNFQPLAPTPPPSHRKPRNIPQGRITGAEIRTMRVRHRKSQRHLADDIHSTQQAISRYERSVDALPFDLYPDLMMWENNNFEVGLVLAVINPKTHEVWRIIG